jgi:hypothetical protein
MLEWFLGLLSAIVNFIMSFFGGKHVTFSEDTKSADDMEVQLPQPTPTFSE